MSPINAGLTLGRRSRDDHLVMVNEMLSGLGLALVSAVGAGVTLKVLIGLVLR